MRHWRLTCNARGPHFQHQRDLRHRPLSVHAVHGVGWGGVAIHFVLYLHTQFHCQLTMGRGWSGHSGSVGYEVSLHVDHAVRWVGLGRGGGMKLCDRSRLNFHCTSIMAYQIMIMIVKSEEEVHQKIKRNCGIYTKEEEEEEDEEEEEVVHSS